ncbi:hypothetical protein BDC45DRAFT_520558 [Circinella umbellata]|nr:hypothetical protein BDC45DRAFT_520558 [Circinella umbellata]
MKNKLSPAQLISNLLIKYIYIIQHSIHNARSCFCSCSIFTPTRTPHSWVFLLFVIPIVLHYLLLLWQNYNIHNI